jgi:hypothetical protein
MQGGPAEYPDRNLIGRLVHVRAVKIFKFRHILPFFLGFDLQDFNGTAARRRFEPKFFKMAYLFGENGLQGCEGFFFRRPMRYAAGKIGAISRVILC